MHIIEDNILIYYQNVRGLRTKVNDFYINILGHNYDLVFLTETWLSESIYNCELFTNDYNVFRKDRDIKRGGGVLIAVRNDFAITEFELNNVNFEAIALKVTLHRSNFYFVNVYFPPNSRRECYQSFYESVSNLPNVFDAKLIIIGDFNLSNVTDSAHNLLNGSPSERSLANFLALHDLLSVNNVLNEYSKTLDLILTNISNCLEISKCAEPILKEDKYHPSIKIKLYMKGSQHNITLKPTPITVPDFKRANFKEIFCSIKHVKWNELKEFEDPDEAIDFFYDSLNCILDKYVPKKKN